MSLLFDKILIHIFLILSFFFFFFLHLFLILFSPRLVEQVFLKTYSLLRKLTGAWFAGACSDQVVVVAGIGAGVDKNFNNEG